MHNRPVTGASDDGPALDALRDEIFAAKHVLLVGRSGSGKSTLLASMLSSGGVLLHARDLASPGSLAARVAASIQTGDVSDDLRDDKRVLLVDGFDEVPRHRQTELADVMATALAGGEVARIVVATRAVPADPSLRAVLTIKQVPALERRAAAQILASLPSSTFAPEGVGEAIYTASGGNPLLLVLLAQQYVDRGQIARGRIGILKGTVDAGVASLVESSNRALSQDAVRDACAQIAVDVLLAEAAQTTEQRVADTLSPLLGREATAHALACSGTDPSALLYRSTTGMVRFQHRLVAEFMAAFALNDDRDTLGALADGGHANEAIGFALHLSRQPEARLVEVARRIGIDAIARLAPHLSMLAPDVVETARTALVAELRAALPSPASANVEPDEPDEPGAATAGWPVKLAARWERMPDSDARGTARGDELEQFMAEFFGEFFKVVRDKYRTKHGEIDLVLEIASREPFWAEHGSDICVECKNWQEAVGFEEIAKVLGARRKSRFRLAFFVARTGFTKDAFEEIRNASEDRRDLLIVPITGEQISHTLAEREEPERFFTNIVRDTMHGRVG